MRRRKTRLGGFFVCFALALAGAAAAQDYEREKRWADQILPVLMLGDAVWLQQKGGHRFLANFQVARLAIPYRRSLPHGSPTFRRRHPEESQEHVSIGPAFR